MSERTPILPVNGELDGSCLDLQMKGVAPHMNSVQIRRPTGRLARAEAAPHAVDLFERRRGEALNIGAPTAVSAATFLEGPLANGG